MNKVYRNSSREKVVPVNVYFNGTLICCIVEIKQNSKPVKMFWIDKTVSTKAGIS